ncbi:MAG: DUF4168 domain-containing protein [Nodosilinea sp.]
MVRYCAAALLVLLMWLMPMAAWASPLPLLAQATTETEAIAIGDSDILGFAKAYQAVQILRMQAEQEMIKAVEDEGLSIDRFNAIAEAQIAGSDQIPAATAKAAELQLSPQEDRQFKATVDRIIAIRQSTEGEMEKAIEADGFSLSTFNNILEQSAGDTDLQRRISDEIVKQTLASEAS